ncbi:MAG: hypothetical protein PHU79_00465 [Oscillospiraceae bacterium]|nr:hypothetical protein [Oscillospiraceae bacterium]
MKTIAYVVPYFGRLPRGFPFWLMSCTENPTVTWLLFTDDRTAYLYPPNVQVTYCTLPEIKKKAQRLFDFPIRLEKAYKLCDFKPAYGEIFSEELVGYDFWGHCDLDMVWGSIRSFLTDDILERYEKVGSQGHSTLYKNTAETNARYRTCVPGKADYRKAFSTDAPCTFDEPPMERIYQYLHLPYYHKVNYIHLKKYDYGFFMDLLPETDNWKNKYQVFTWKNGEITRYYLQNASLQTEKYMYLHYWCRPTTFRISVYDPRKQYFIYPDTTTERDGEITPDLVRRKSRRSKLRYYAKSIWFSRKKLTAKRILFNLKGMASYRKEEWK